LILLFSRYCICDVISIFFFYYFFSTLSYLISDILNSFAQSIDCLSGSVNSCFTNRFYVFKCLVIWFFYFFVDAVSCLVAKRNNWCQDHFEISSSYFHRFFSTIFNFLKFLFRFIAYSYFFLIRDFWTDIFSTSINSLTDFASNPYKSVFK